jgi:DNA-directed RNA polymerase I subunit RPA49
MAPSVDAGKKRKRHTDGSSKPSKRVAIDDSKEIKLRVQDSDEWAPVIGQQHHLFPLYML